MSGTVRGCPGVSGALGSRDWLPASPRKALTLTVRDGLVPWVRGRSLTTRRTMRRERSCQAHRSQTGQDQQAGQPRSGTPSRPSARRTMWRPRSGQPLWPGCQWSRNSSSDLAQVFPLPWLPCRMPSPSLSWTRCCALSWTSWWARRSWPGSIRRTSRAEGGSGGVCTCWPGTAGRVTTGLRAGLSGCPAGPFDLVGPRPAAHAPFLNCRATSRWGLAAADDLAEVDQVGSALLAAERPGHADTPGDTHGGSRPAQIAHSSHSIRAGNRHYDDSPTCGALDGLPLSARRRDQARESSRNAEGA